MFGMQRNADYDLNDPFIDDSELAIDDRTHFAQTKQQGFYVSSGEVALLKDKCMAPAPLISSSGLSQLTHTLSLDPLRNLAPSTHFS